MNLNEIIQSVEWKPVPIYPFGENYEVSNTGQVRRKDTGQIIRQWDHVGKGGVVYKRVTLRMPGLKKNYRVHRLVALAFLPPSDLPEVDHIDGNSFNNNVDNLEWVNSKENLRRMRERQRKSKSSLKDTIFN